MQRAASELSTAKAPSAPAPMYAWQSCMSLPLPLRSLASARQLPAVPSTQRTDLATNYPSRDSFQKLCRAAPEGRSGMPRRWRGGSGVGGGRLRLRLTPEPNASSYLFHLTGQKRTSSCPQPSLTHFHGLKRGFVPFALSPIKQLGLTHTQVSSDGCWRKRNMPPPLLPTRKHCKQGGRGNPHLLPPTVYIALQGTWRNPGLAPLPFAPHLPEKTSAPFCFQGQAAEANAHPISCSLFS